MREGGVLEEENQGSSPRWHLGGRGGNLGTFPPRVVISEAFTEQTLQSLEK